MISCSLLKMPSLNTLSQFSQDTGHVLLLRERATSPPSETWRFRFNQSCHSPSLQGMLTKPLVNLIQAQGISQSVDREMVLSSKKRLNRFRNTQQANSVLIHLTPELRRVQLAQEKGASSRFSVLPLDGRVWVFSPQRRI